MDSSRKPQSPDNKRRRSSPSTEVHHMSAPSQPQATTSLPSIRQLYLSPSSTLPHLSNELSSYSYNTSSHYPSMLDPSSSHLSGTVPSREGAGYGGGAGESDGDDVEQRGPPKKKRRRQALSCTECKRRKIKCDRIQPCTPCARRGEEAGCQWHIVEPIEKYATKAEFDELKARFDHLAALVQRLLPLPANVHPYYQMGGLPGVPGEAVQPPYSTATSGSNAAYSTLMHPPQSAQQSQSYSHHVDTSSSQVSNRYIKPEESHSPTRHAHQMPGVQNPSPPLQPILPRPRIQDNSPASTAANVKTSPLALSSITSPFHPDQSQHQQTQSKNYHAQTLMLGERLRPGSEDPVIYTLRTILLTQTICLMVIAALLLLALARLHLLTNSQLALHAELMTLVRTSYLPGTMIGLV